MAAFQGFFAICNLRFAMPKAKQSVGDPPPVRVKLSCFNFTRATTDSCVITEADTCRKYVLPKLYAAGWDDDQISEQKTFTDGRIVVVGTKTRRRPAKRADYLLRYAATSCWRSSRPRRPTSCPATGCSRPRTTPRSSASSSPTRPTAMASSSSTLLTGKERHLDAFPTPDELWERFRASEKIEDDETASRLLTPA